MEEKDSFAAALKKAREIAAKMQVNTKIPESSSAQKGEGRVEDYGVKKRLALQIANNLSRRLPKDLRVLSEGMDREGRMVIHLMIPTILVCLFGGRDNETLKWMQEKTRVQMEMNLEHTYANSNEKPLTIIGEPDRVEAARELVKQYIREKDEILGVSASNMQVSLGIEYSELLIPKEAVGLVIGKQGENIKKVNNETGCIVKFRPLGPRDDERFRVCTFHGTAQQIKKAREQLSELVEYLKQKFGLTRPIPKPGQEFAEVRVSATKAGVVIGKGGETIKQINNLSGATVCIDRSVPEGSEYRTFFVVGEHEQVEHAKHLIREKSGESCDVPAAAILALNPLADPYFNQAPIPPLFAAPLQPSTPCYPSDSGALLHPPIGAPAMSPYIQPQYQQPSEQDYSAAWAAYYQQYYSNYQPPADGAPQSNADQTAYWQQYYQYYQQNPEYYQQYQAQQQAQSQAQNTIHVQQSVQQSSDQVNFFQPTLNERQCSQQTYQFSNEQSIAAQSNLSSEAVINPQPVSIKPLNVEQTTFEHLGDSNGLFSEQPNIVEKTLSSEETKSYEATLEGECGFQQSSTQELNIAEQPLSNEEMNTAESESNEQQNMKDLTEFKVQNGSASPVVPTDIIPKSPSPEKYPSSVENTPPSPPEEAAEDEPLPVTEESMEEFPTPTKRTMPRKRKRGAKR